MPEPLRRAASRQLRLARPAGRWFALALRLVALVMVGAVASGCTGLPPLDGRTPSQAATDTDDTRLGRALVPRVAAHPGLSGIHPLTDSLDAFAARALLAKAADRTLDVQYYIWHDDLSGTLLLDALHEAAERGVRVRLLLDDHGSWGIDAALAVLDEQPNIEVRLFNPLVPRQARWIGYLTDFSRANRRMHNKSFTADSQATIIGGRNVGDEYFGAADGVLFADLDVLAVGPVVKDVSADFDRYWASGSAYPADRLLAPATAAQLEQVAGRADRVADDPSAAGYVQRVRQSPFAADLIGNRLAMEWAPVRMVSDDPAKALGQAGPEGNLTHELWEIIGEPRQKIDLVSAYFVPGAAGVDAFAAHVERGVEVEILTNALEATDVAVVHAGYAKRRKDLLAAGVKLYELRLQYASPPDQERSLVRGGSSGSSLHAKTFSVDSARVFVGSFNFDPRSIHLNTELGFVIDSPVLAHRIRTTLERRLPETAYRVQLSDDGELYWLERRGDALIRHDTEPGTRWWLRMSVWLLSLLPIEWML
jgi:cardiolipin synthase C